MTMRVPRVAAVLLAAGSSVRMGRPKVLLCLDGRSLLCGWTEAALRSGAAEVVVVVGPHAPEALRELEDPFVVERKSGRLRLAVCERHREGMSASIRQGLREVSPGSDAALFALCDHVYPSAGLIDLLVEAYAAAFARGEHRGRIVAPYKGQRRGNPVLFDASLFRALSSLEGDEGGKRLVEAMPDRVLRVNAGLEAFADMDTPEDYLLASRRVPRMVVWIRGAGDLGTAVAHRLHMSGFRVVMTEVAEPRVERRLVSFGECVCQGRITVEGVTAVRAASIRDLEKLWAGEYVPVLVDPEGTMVEEVRPLVIVDARMAKRNLGTTRGQAHVVIGLGPGFCAGGDVDAVVETRPGPTVGRVILEGFAAEDTGIPEEIAGVTLERTIVCEADGEFRAVKRIGDRVEAGEVLGYVGKAPVRAGVSGVIWGLARDGLRWKAGAKIGDIDPRGDPQVCRTIPGRSRAVAGGVLEAILYSLYRRVPPGD